MAAACRRVAACCRHVAAFADGTHRVCAQVFDVAAVRAALQGRLHSLESELHQVRPRGWTGLARSP